jgi:hypothetical protein
MADCQPQTGSNEAVAVWKCSAWTSAISEGGLGALLPISSSADEHLEDSSIALELGACVWRGMRGA